VEGPVGIDCAAAGMWIAGRKWLPLADAPVSVLRSPASVCRAGQTDGAASVLSHGPLLRVVVRELGLGSRAPPRDAQQPAARDLPASDLIAARRSASPSTSTRIQCDLSAELLEFLESAR
jgi:hypothetical protein